MSKMGKRIYSKLIKVILKMRSQHYLKSLKRPKRMTNLPSRRSLRLRSKNYLILKTRLKNSKTKKKSSSGRTLVI